MEKRTVSDAQPEKQAKSEHYDIPAIPDTFDNIMRAVVRVPVEKVEEHERDGRQ